MPVSPSHTVLASLRDVLRDGIDTLLPDTILLPTCGRMPYTIPYGIGAIAMPTLTTTEARKKLYELIADLQHDHEPVQITSKRGNAVLLSEDDWRAVQETLYLVSIPGMRDSILEGMATPADELDDELDG
ncbi:MAG: type II toxin-antitoxin system Phd/YefM family antitoxin [Acidimicrobiales bacterium]|nr:type II toxin-antitoxin system Phd/YefM family antitoxin [Acidimicrobiales bacterium]